jgi:hypothetical protein
MCRCLQLSATHVVALWNVPSVAGCLGPERQGGRSLARHEEVEGYPVQECIVAGHSASRLGMQAYWKQLSSWSQGWHVASHGDGRSLAVNCSIGPGMSNSCGAPD